MSSTWIQVFVLGGASALIFLAVARSLWDEGKIPEKGDDSSDRKLSRILSVGFYLLFALAVVATVIGLIIIQLSGSP